MDDYFLSVEKEDGALLCIAPLSNRQVAMANIDLADASGLFLFEQRGIDESGEINIIARVLSEEGALMFQNMFRMT